MKLFAKLTTVFGVACALAANVAFAQAPAPPTAKSPAGTAVKGYTRKTKGGKMVTVKGYTRKPKTAVGATAGKTVTVKGYTRKTKGGKMVTVKGYTRKAGAHQPGKPAGKM